MKLLVKLGANPRALDKEGRSALHYFAKGFPDVEKSRGKDVVPVDDIVRYLVRTCGIDLNVKTRDNRFTALHIAVEYDLVHVACALLRNGADVNSVDWRGKNYGFPAVFVRPKRANFHSLSNSDSLRTFRFFWVVNCRCYRFNESELLGTY
jgi:hypothetical protein